MTPDVEARLHFAAARFAEELVAALRDEVAAERDAPDRLLDVDQAAELLGVGRTFTYREIAAGRLKSLKVGRRRLVSSSAITAYIASRGR